MKAWLLDVLLGPKCQMPGCNYRARGPRSLIAHLWEHAGQAELMTGEKCCYCGGEIEYVEHSGAYPLDSWWEHVPPARPWPAHMAAPAGEELS